MSAAIHNSDAPESARAHDHPGTRPPPSLPGWLKLLLLVCTVAGLAWLLGPALLWAYEIERAGYYIDAGSAWPEPRGALSLPQLRDRQALEAALPYLDSAIAWRPADAHAYRLSGQVYIALGDYARAAASYEQAIARAPAAPLLRWEASLVYRQMQQQVESAPRTPLTDVFANGALQAPGELVKSLFCNASGAATCYFGRAKYRQPFAAYPDEMPINMPALFLHPPAGLLQRITVPPEQTGLHFVVGLDPVAREWGTDGASFRVWVQPAGGERALVAELPVDRAMALRGWVPGWADLSPWAGQTVELLIESGAGPRGDRADDWYGWADLALMPPDAARYAALLPGLRAALLERSIP